MLDSQPKSSVVKRRPILARYLHFSSELRTKRHAHLLPPPLGCQVLLGGQRADGADPRLGHAFDPQHHPAKLLALRHHPVKLLKTGPDLCLHNTGHTDSDT